MEELTGTYGANVRAAFASVWPTDDETEYVFASALQSMTYVSCLDDFPESSEVSIIRTFRDLYLELDIRAAYCETLNRVYWAALGSGERRDRPLIEDFYSTRMEGSE